MEFVIKIKEKEIKKNANRLKLGIEEYKGYVRGLITLSFVNNGFDLDQLNLKLEVIKNGRK